MPWASHWLIVSLKMCKSKGKNVCKPQDQIFVIQIKKLFKNVFWYFLTNSHDCLTNLDNNKTKCN